MTARVISISLILIGLFIQAKGQTIKKKVETLFDNNRNLLEKTEESYNINGLLTKSVYTTYKQDKSITITNYLYNKSGQLIKEDFYGLDSYRDSTKKTYWTDTSIIYIKTYTNDTVGRVLNEKEYSFQCNLDTCDMTMYFYEREKLIKKYCILNCTSTGLYNSYPIYYKYDINDSLILEQAMEPKDTTKVWYANSYDYSSLPDKYIYQRFYRKDDTLQLDSRTVIRNEYLPDGKKSKTIYLEKKADYIFFQYYKNGLLKSQSYVSNGIICRKWTYSYNKEGKIVKYKNYDNNRIKAKDKKLKLYYYQKTTYDYY